jgi:hypothetical protein
MDVRVLILWHPGDTFHASVVALDLGRGWHKVYTSKKECMDDLWRVGLLTLVERYDGMRSDFEVKDRILIAQAIIEAQELETAGFVETTPKF